MAVAIGSAAGVPAKAMPLLEGYGLHRSGRIAEPGRPVQAFVEYLIEQHGEEALLRFFRASISSGDAASAAEDAFGSSIEGLENRFFRSKQGGSTVALRSFLASCLHYVRPYWANQLEIALLAGLGLAFVVASAKITELLFDDVLTVGPDGGFKGSFQDAVPLLGVLLLGLAVSLLANLRQSYATSSLSNSVLRDIRIAMFRQLQVLPLRWHRDQDKGDLMSRFLADVQIVEAGLTGFIREGVLQVVHLIVASLLLLQLSWPLAVVTLLTTPIAVVVYRRMGPGAQTRSMTAQERRADLSTLLEQNLDAQRVVKTFGLEARESQRFDLATARLRTAEIRLNFFTGMFGLSVGAVTSVTRIAVMAIGIWLVLEGQSTVGALVAFIGVMGEVVGPMMQLADLGQTVQMSMGAFTRIEEISDAVPDLREPENPIHLPEGPLGVELRDVSFAYAHGPSVLRSISLQISPGSRVAVVGTSGAGKSTLLDLLQRIDDPTAGTVLVSGVDLQEADLTQYRDRIGVVSQENYLFSGSVRDNIVLGRPGATDDEVVEAAEAAGLADLVDASQAGLSTPVGRGGADLSVGQRQRVAIARLFLRSPDLIILDEATSALDALTERAVMGSLARLSEGRTMVSITHRLTTMDLYDWIVVLHDGDVAEQGNHADLLAAAGLYARMWTNSQRSGIPAADLPGIDQASAQNA